MDILHFSNATTLEDTNTSITALSANEMVYVSLANAIPGLAADTSDVLLETKEETHVKQICNSEDTNQEETALKQPPILVDSHAETPIKQRHDPKNSDLMVQEIHLTAPHSVQLQSPTSFDKEELTNCHASNTETSGAEPLQNRVNPETADVEPSWDRDDHRADTESSIHDHQSHHGRSPASMSFTEQPELSLHETSQIHLVFVI